MQCILKKISSVKALDCLIIIQRTYFKHENKIENIFKYIGINNVGNEKNYRLQRGFLKKRELGWPFAFFLDKKAL